MGRLRASGIRRTSTILTAETPRLGLPITKEPSLLPEGMEESSTSVKEAFSKARRLCLEEERQLVEVDAYQLRNPAV